MESFSNKRTWLRWIPLAAAALILFDIISADLFILKNPQLIYTKVGWLELCILVVLPFWPWGAIPLCLLAILHWGITGSFQMVFSSFPVFILLVLWWASNLVSRTRAANFAKSMGNR